jgi:sugar lactone lactonase YvrE
MLRRCAISALFVCTPLAALADPLGKQPTYTDRKLTEVPNAAAITRRIWAPGLDDGYVPQGLTVHAGTIYVGAYKSTDPKQDKGPCRLFRLDPATGAITGTLDLPASCGHAGGLARGTPGRLYVADTKVVFEVTLAPAGDPTIGRVTRTVQLTGAVKGSFAAASDGHLWLGTFTREPGARLYRFPLAKLAAARWSEADATLALPIPENAQGAAFDSTGRLWITRSLSRYGELLELDLKTGAPVRRFAMPAAIEDISFAPDGGLWAMSEAGAQRWNTWPAFFPVVFRLDPTRLR